MEKSQALIMMCFIPATKDKAIIFAFCILLVMTWLKVDDVVGSSMF